MKKTESLGQHLRKRRLGLGLWREDVANRLNVSVWSYRNWKNGRTIPGTIIYRRIVEFLGYYPHPTSRNLGHRLRKIRRCLGLTSRQAGHLAEVDQGTFLMWECGSWTPTARTRAKVDQFIARLEPGLPLDCPPLADLIPHPTADQILPCM